MQKQSMIQARVSDSTLKEIDFLKIQLGISQTTRIIELALHHLADEYKKQKELSPFDALYEMKLIGSLELDSNLSTDYKEIIKKGLKKKSSKKKAKKIGKKK